MREGEKSEVSFFVIADGSATVSVDGNEVTQLGPGDYFGELALIDERVRSGDRDHGRACAASSWGLGLPAIRRGEPGDWKLLRHASWASRGRAQQPSRRPR